MGLSFLFAPLSIPAKPGRGKTDNSPVMFEGKGGVGVAACATGGNQSIVEVLFRRMFTQLADISVTRGPTTGDEFMPLGA